MRNSGDGLITNGKRRSVRSRCYVRPPYTHTHIPYSEWKLRTNYRQALTRRVSGIQNRNPTNAFGLRFRGENRFVIFVGDVFNVPNGIPTFTLRLLRPPPAYAAIVSTGPNIT